MQVRACCATMAGARGNVHAEAGIWLVGNGRIGGDGVQPNGGRGRAASGAVFGKRRHREQAWSPKPSPRPPASRSKSSPPAPACCSGASRPRQANPQADVIWGVSSSLLKDNSKYFAALCREGARRRSGGVSRCQRSLDRHQPAGRDDQPEHQSHSGHGRPEKLGRSAEPGMEAARSPTPIRRIRASPMSTRLSCCRSGATTMPPGRSSARCWPTPRC